jgi:hypothetical protein
LTAHYCIGKWTWAQRPFWPLVRELIWTEILESTRALCGAASKINGSKNNVTQGFSHIGLSTLDLDKTREFYEGVLGFEPGH